MEFGILAVVGAIVGAIASWFLVGSTLKNASQKSIDEANSKADITLKEAKLAAQRITDEAETRAEKVVAKAEGHHESIKQKKIQEAKEKFNSLKAEFDTEKAQHVVQMKEREFELVQKEAAFTQKSSGFEAKQQEVKNKEVELDSLRENLDKQLKIVTKKREELDAANEQRIKMLESVARLTQQEAKDQLLEAVRAKSKSESLTIVRDAVNEAKLNANKEAKKIIIQTIQRMSAEYTIENTVSVFNLESDELKGQIIGREGRNIRALEAATGVELIVDDTPEAIVISLLILCAVRLHVFHFSVLWPMVVSTLLVLRRW